VVNPQTRMLYYGVTGIGGLVIAPTADLFCTYTGDGNSMATVCDPLGGDGSTCIPGCSPSGKQCQEIRSPFGCSYAPTHLKDALTDQQAGQASRNNELVVDTRSIVSGLPTSIEAFWYTPYSNAGEVQRLQQVHRGFLREYGLTELAGPPLLTLDLTSRGGSRPFRLASLSSLLNASQSDALQQVNCKSWCNKWTCTAEPCTDCGPDLCPRAKTTSEAAAEEHGVQ